jgi:hypothetical protein
MQLKNATHQWLREGTEKPWITIAKEQHCWLAKTFASKLFPSAKHQLHQSPTRQGKPDVERSSINSLETGRSFQLHSFLERVNVVARRG